MPATTWNPADKAAAVTLSGGDLTASSGASDDAVRATASKSSEKWYWEVRVDSGTNAAAIGIANATHVLTAYIGGSVNSLAVMDTVGTIRYNGNTVGTSLGTITTGDIISIAHDANAGTVAFRKNNGTAVTISGANVPTGALFPAYSGTNATSTVTANFGASSYVYAIPEGFLSFDPYLLNYTVSVSGGTVIGGTSPVTSSFTVFTPSGGTTIGGSATVSSVSIVQHTITPAGGIFVAGDAPISELLVQVVTIVPEGGAVLSGVALVKEAIAYLPTGGIVAGGEAVVRDLIPFTPSGGAVVGGAAAVLFVINIAPTGGAVVGGTAPLAVVVVETPTGGLTIAGVATVTTFEAWFSPSGGMKAGGTAIAYALAVGESVTAENPYNDDFPGWAVNLETSAPSRYWRLPANSMCQFNGRTYVANAAGIYSIDAANDAGQPIRAAVELAQTDYGSENNKRIPDVQIGIKTDGKMRLHVATNRASRKYYSVTRDDGVMVANRVKIGQGIEGRYWSLGLSNVNGCDFELESMAFSPTILKRHGK